MTIADELRPGDYVTPSVRLVQPIGQGGMGTVWLAEHLVLDTRVVVKVMAKGLESRADVLARFAREAMIAAQVKSPHVVQVFDSGTTESGVPFIVMELLEGHDLGKQLADHGPLTPQALVPIVVQIAKALSKAHRVGVVHRDIKPENIFLCDTEGGEPFVKLLDFGTAKVELPDRRGMTSTDTGQVLGTPLYMSPEQILGEKEIDHRTDIWALGVVVFEALTGRVPFEGATIAALALAIHGEPPKMSDVAPDLPPALDRWFARACARPLDARFQTAREAADAFVQAVTGAPMLEPFESMRAPSVAVRPIERVPVNTERPVQLSATLPKPGEERRHVSIAFGVVVAAALGVAAMIVARSPSPGASAHAEPTTAVAPAAPAPPAPPPSTNERNEVPPPPPATVAQAPAPAKTHAPAPPKPNPPMKAPRATSTRPVKPARAKDAGGASAPAAPANPDEDLERLSNIAPPSPPATTTPPAPAPEKLPPPELPPE